MASSDGLERRRLVAADIPAAHALSIEVGWNQTQSDWKLMLDHGDGLCVADRGRIVATALAHRVGAVAWISMVLVARTYRRRGLATELLARSIEAIVDRGAIPGLDATEAGRAVYEPLGFRAIYPLDRRVATMPSNRAPASGAVRRMASADLPAVIRYDAAAFGADRGHILRHLLERAPELALIAADASKLRGFVLGRGGREAMQIGPLIADDPAVAIELADAAIARVSGRVYIDSLGQHRELNAHLGMRGFVVQRGFTRMLLGRSTPFDTPERIFAVAGPELA